MSKETYEDIVANNEQTVTEDQTKIEKTKNYTKKEETDYTIFVYMIGSDLESMLGNGTRDIDEISEANIPYDKTNVLVYTGGANRWVENIPVSSNCVLDLSISHQKKRIVGRTGKSVSMGAAGTLADFLKFGRENYPAKHYSLVFWDHGAGPVWGFGNDELHDGDMLMLSELREGLSDADMHFDWIGFDACLMASIETMDVVRPYADYFIGSEELEPGSGWDYTALSILEETFDAKKIASAIAKSYETYYLEEADEFYHPEMTISVTDLSKLEAVKEAFDQVAGKLAASMEEGSYEEIAQLRKDSKTFGLVEGEKGANPYYYDLIDLGDFTKKFASVYPKESKKLTKALSQFVVEARGNVNGAEGVSIYYPYKNQEMYDTLEDHYRETSISSTYMLFLEMLSDYVISDTDWTLGSLVELEDEYTYTLTKDQQKDVTAAYINVYEKGTLSDAPRVLKRRMTVGEDGVIHIPKDQKILYFVSNGAFDETDLGGRQLGDNASEEIAVIVTQLEGAEQTQKGAHKQKYRLEDVFLVRDPEFEEGDDEQYTIPVTIPFLYNEKKDKIQIQNISLKTDDYAFGGKSTIDLSEYEQISFGGSMFKKTFYSLEAELNLEWKSCIEKDMSISIELELEDSKGEIHIVK
ncbi:MAG: clostripain-related cysteine peptidase [Lachnospiraceae bacterium]|nr:clostripain-related cysteine peptidase [Lachnospiraceae bacterium]